MIDPNLKEYLHTNLFKYKIEEGGLINIDGKLFYFHDVDKPVLADNGELSLIFDNKLLDVTLRYLDTLYGVIFKLGPWYLYTKTDSLAHVDLEELKYIGKASHQIYFDSYLGIHGRYERMCGVGEYSDWVEKAQFLGYKTLGICERSTLGGVLQFQKACIKKGIKPISGYSLPVETGAGDRVDLKLYVKNQEGWSNLLLLNKLLHTSEYSYIEIESINQDFKGLVCVTEPGLSLTDKFIEFVLSHFEDCFLQISDKEYSSNLKDKEYLESLQKYLDTESWQKKLPPILIHDTYCLDSEHTHLRDILIKQGGVEFQNSTRGHYFHSSQELMTKFLLLFDSNRFQALLKTGIESLNHVSEICNYIIDDTKKFLPTYEMNEEEVKLYPTNNDLFIALLDEAFKKKITTNKKAHWDRMIRELGIIKQGFVDYFLILWDICNWSRANNIQVGPGRGSAAGSLISYLLGVTAINPLDFDLLFERFLNESRIKSEFPDIDIDFASDRRDEVIDYMKNKYGEQYVCRVGTYNTLQLKGVVQELERFYGNTSEITADKITRNIEGSNSTWKTLIYESMTNKRLKTYVENNMEIVRDSKYVINSIKSMSIHACATIVVPKLRGVANDEIDLFKQIPVRMDGDILVSEWEGNSLADIGYLKVDILSTKQMAKFGHIIDLVEKNTGNRLNVDDIPLDDDNVYDLFRRGVNQDVFHFGTKGLTGYLKLVQPFHIEDLIATISLYRPGVMASGTHMRFVDLRRGIEEVVYDHPSLQELTANTYGLYIYQEQIMKIAQVLGNFTLVEADGVRKAMGKMIKSKMEEYRQIFLKGADDNGCESSRAVEIWNKMEVFSSYGFNKSHAAAYSIVGYQCNWLKFYHPLEFWTIALEFAESDKISMMVSEINSSGKIEVKAPDINLSEREFFSSVEKQTIYWNLTQIAYMGPAAVEAVLSERARGGQFFSFEEFCERVGSGVKKTSMINCIISGCFDEIEKVKQPKDRFKLIERYMFTIRGDFKYSKEDKATILSLQEKYSDDLHYLKHELDKIQWKCLPAEYVNNRDNNYYWILKQSDISKINLLNYEKLIKDFKMSGKLLLEEEFSKEVTKRGESFILPGILSEIQIKVTKTNKSYCVGNLQQGSGSVPLRMWSEAMGKSNMEKFVDGALVVLKGRLYLNDFFGTNEFLVEGFTEIL